MERLRQIREQVGYSQQDLADESGVSQHTISEIELGRRKPQGRTLRKLASVLGVEVRDLFEEAHPLAQAPPDPSAQERREPKVHTAEAHLVGEGTLWAKGRLIRIATPALQAIIRGAVRGELTEEEAMDEVEKAETR